MPIKTTKKKTREQTKKRKEGLSINVCHNFLIRMVTVAIMKRIIGDKKRKVMLPKNELYRRCGGMTREVKQQLTWGGGVFSAINNCPE